MGVLVLAEKKKAKKDFAQHHTANLTSYVDHSCKRGCSCKDQGTDQGIVLLRRTFYKAEHGVYVSLHVFSLTSLCLLLKASFRKEGLTSIILTP